MEDGVHYLIITLLLLNAASCAKNALVHFLQIVLYLKKLI